MITPLYAGLIGLLLVALSLRVALTRRKERIGIGDNGNKRLSRAIRVQANLVEYAPMALLLMLLAEMQNVSAVVLHSFGIALVLARLGHAWGLSGSIGVTPGRFIGTLVTFGVIVGLATVNIVKALG